MIKRLKDLQKGEKFIWNNSKYQLELKTDFEIIAFRFNKTTCGKIEKEYPHKKAKIYFGSNCQMKIKVVP